MHQLLSAISVHPYLILFALVFAEAVGLPVPVPVVLLAAGGASSKNPAEFGMVLLIAISTMLLGNILMYVLGRSTGWWLLGILCRFSLNPEACILESAEAFRRRGRVLLVIAKFIPGIHTIASPLAGSMSMRFTQFVALDLAGASLYAVAFCGAGYLLGDLLSSFRRAYEAFGQALAWATVLALAVYFVYRVILWLKARTLTPVPMVSAKEIAARFYGESESKIAIFDARSHGYYSPGALRIKGSTRLEPNTILQQIEALPKEKEIILYCTCLREATSIRVARILQEHGLRPVVITGGLRAWKKADLPLERVPAEDVVLLPSFS